MKRIQINDNSVVYNVCLGISAILCGVALFFLFIILLAVAMDYISTGIFQFSEVQLRALLVITIVLLPIILLSILTHTIIELKDLS